MKKRKITYSLTAQQKKKLKQQKALGNKALAEEQVPQEQSEEVAVSKKSNRKIVIYVVSAILLAVVIFLAIYIPIKLSSNKEIVNHETFLNWKNYNPNDPSKPYDKNNPNPNPTPNPIATITLTGDDQAAFNSIFGENKVEVKVEIFMDDAKYAGMNFMYLAESGFYNGTIIHDVNRGMALFNGFTDTKNAANRAKEGNILLNLKGFVEHNVSSWNTANFKLGYRLSTESSRSVINTSQSALGYLLMMSGTSTNYSTSTAFMLTTSENPQFNFGDDNMSITSYLSWLGRIVDDESMTVVTKLNSVATSLSGTSYCPNTAIRIESITTNLSTSRKDYLLNNFESLIKDGLGVSSLNWRNVAYSESYYKFKS